MRNIGYKVASMVNTCMLYMLASTVYKLTQNNYYMM
nr:MAG TPA: hypothetical protein [Bacteriophage sp.]